MTIHIGADHNGFALKEYLKKALTDDGHAVIDEGDAEQVPADDYPIFAAAVARSVAKDKDARGIVICGSGFGVDIVANKIDGIRSALAASPEQIFKGRHDDDVNVLALASDFLDQAQAHAIARVFIETPFAREERYARRLGEIADIERTN